MAHALRSTCWKTAPRLDADDPVLQLRRRQPQRDRGDVGPPGGSAGALRRRCTLPNLICDASSPHLPANPLGPRPPPWREAAAGVPGARAVCATPPTCSASPTAAPYELGKKADINVIDMNALRLPPARDRLRPARRWAATRPGRQRIHRDHRRWRRDASRRRGHRRPPRSPGARSSLSLILHPLDEAIEFDTVDENVRRARHPSGVGRRGRPVRRDHRRHHGARH